MQVLLHTPSGYALFKMPLGEEDKFPKACQKLISGEKSISDCLTLVKFQRFAGVEEAMKSISHHIGNVFRPTKALRALMKGAGEGEEGPESVAVEDIELAAGIQEKYSISCVCNSTVSHLARLMRNCLSDLLKGEEGASDMEAMRQAVARTYSCDKVQFDPEKEDTMVVQASALIDDVDKELNNYVMRCREWYGWHFPELGKLVPDSVNYAKVVKAVGSKQEAHRAKLTLQKILKSEELVEKILDEAEHSMGTEVSLVDMVCISQLCDQIIEMANYRVELLSYLKERMHSLAPNLTVLVGELMAAKLVHRAGSLIKLAKLPASTIQLLGAENALFRALKKKQPTPKYGIIYHSSLITHADGKEKARMARKLAAKVSLVARYDAFRDRDSKTGHIVKKEEGDEEKAGTEMEEGRAFDAEMGIECRAYLEGELKRAQQLTKREAKREAKKEEELDGMPAAKRPRLQ